MKLLNLFLCSALAENAVGRHRREATRISLTGNENPDQLMDYLTEMAGGESDELEEMIKQLMGTDRTASEIQVRKFRHLKLLVLHLQEEQKFGRYCYYGCYCLPEGSHDISTGGYGKPLDNIDRACRDFKWCYQCLVREHNEAQPNQSWGGNDECRGEDIGYQVDLITDAEGNKSIECLNKVGACRRNICECDKRLAMQLAQFEDEWNEGYHTVKGGFVREDNCKRAGGQGNPVEECCGGLKDFPWNQPKRSNQCCDGPLAKPAGSC